MLTEKPNGSVVHQVDTWDAVIPAKLLLGHPAEPAAAAAVGKGSENDPTAAAVQPAGVTHLPPKKVCPSAEARKLFGAVSEDGIGLGKADSSRMIIGGRIFVTKPATMKGRRALR